MEASWRVMKSRAVKKHIPSHKEEFNAQGQLFVKQNLPKNPLVGPHFYAIFHALYL